MKIDRILNTIRKKEGVRMNDINVSIPYSFFKDIFEDSFKYNLMPTTDERADLSIENVKKYWILLNSGTRNELIRLSKCYISLNGRKKTDVKDFLQWAEDNIHNQHQWLIWKS